MTEILLKGSKTEKISIHHIIPTYTSEERTCTYLPLNDTLIMEAYSIFMIKIKECQYNQMVVILSIGYFAIFTFGRWLYILFRTSDIRILIDWVAGQGSGV